MVLLDISDTPCTISIFCRYILCTKHHLARPFNSSTQYAGRLHRLHADKKHVVIYDYVDSEVPVLARMYAKRRAGYRAIGYEIPMPEDGGKAIQLTL
jgi:hypothetical protein